MAASSAGLLSETGIAAPKQLTQHSSLESPRTGNEQTSQLGRISCASPGPQRAQQQQVQPGPGPARPVRGTHVSRLCAPRPALVGMLLHAPAASRPALPFPSLGAVPRHREVFVRQDAEKAWPADGASR